MKSFAAATLAACLALPPAALAHGGVYRGPGSGIPPGGAPSGPSTPGSSGTGGADDDLTRWQYWWAFNQAPYLRLKEHLHAVDAFTGSDAYKLGESSASNLKHALRVSASQLQGVIIPRLLASLRKESSNDIQSSCMIALAKIGDPEGPPGGSELSREVRREIQARLTSTSQELSETAAVALGIYGSREQIPVLTAVLENDLAALRRLDVPQRDNVNMRTRAFAAYGLGLIGHRAGGYDRLVINATLRKLLEGEARSMAQRDVPVACLTAIGLTPLAIDAHELERSGAKPPKHPGALDSRQDQLRFLLGYCADESVPHLTRAQAPTAMARLLGGADIPQALPLRTAVAERLLQSLAKDSRDTSAMQQSCILALGVIGDCDGDPIDVAIRATLARVDELLADQQARRFALIALAQAAGAPGDGAGERIQGVATGDAEQNARAYLLRRLARERGTIRPWLGLAVAILERSLQDAGLAPSSDALLALRSCLAESGSPDTLGALAIACGLARERGAKEFLLEKLASLRDTQARGHVAIALGLLDEQSAVAPLEELVKQSRYQADLLRSAATALGLLGDKQAVPDLIEMLSSATSLSAQAAICTSLGTIGDSRSVHALLELLSDDRETELARAFAAVALGIVADKEDLPWNAKISVGCNYRANTQSLTDGKGGILDIL